MSRTCPAFATRELEIPADLEAPATHEWAARAAGDFGLAEEDRFQVKLAMSEAVTNAIIHGSDRDGDSVRIAARGERDRLVFEVADEGRRDGEEPVERLADGGRGLELVSMVMDDVELVRAGDGGLLRFAKRRED